MQNAGLNGRAQRHHLIGIDALVRLTTEERLNRLDNLGHAGHAAHQNHFVDIGGLQTGVLERLLAGTHGLGDEVLDQGLQLGAGELYIEMQRTGRVHGDERQIHLVLRGR